MKIKNKCIDCGKIINKKRKRCRKCYIKYSQVPENNPNWKDGITKKKYYCKCGNGITWQTAIYGQNKCKICANRLNRNPKNHKNNCQCGACKTIGGELSGKNHSNYGKRA